MPPTVPINHYLDPITNKTDLSPIPLFHACVFRANACLEHSDFFKVKCQITRRPVKAHQGSLADARRHPDRSPCADWQKFNYELLTATTLIYAIGAGITAAAGTRLALQLFLDKLFKLFSLQSRKAKSPRVVISCHYLPESGLGNLRACCLP